MASLPRRAFRYLFRIAPLPHATGTASALVGARLLETGLEICAEGAALTGTLATASGFGWSGLAILCFADGYGRYREYLRLKRALDRRGFSVRLLRPLAASRCQRDAAVQAAREFGHGERATAFFRALGCRWFHLLPDRVVANPFHFFSPRFLRVTFLPDIRPNLRLRRSPPPPAPRIDSRARRA